MNREEEEKKTDLVPWVGNRRLGVAGGGRWKAWDRHTSTKRGRRWENLFSTGRLLLHDA